MKIPAATVNKAALSKVQELKIYPICTGSCLLADLAPNKLISNISVFEQKKRAIFQAWLLEHLKWFNNNPANRFKILKKLLGS